MTKNQIDYWRNKEIERSNRANEAELHRANVAKESETARANRQHEAIQSATLAESQRHSQEQEAIDRERNAINQQNYLVIQAETERHNRATEQVIPYQIRQSAASTLKTVAETDLVRQQERTSQAQEDLHRTSINAQSISNLNTLAHTDLINQQKATQRAQQALFEAQTRVQDVTVPKTQSETIRNLTQSYSNISNTVNDTINSVRDRLGVTDVKNMAGSILKSSKGRKPKLFNTAVSLY